MQNFGRWWQKRSKGEIIALTIACYVFIALASMDIGRALYRVFH